MGIKRNRKIIIVVGPTASGKSDLAVEIAKDFNGEIISADSRQVYKNMDLGTGKITKKEMREIPHHLLDIASPKRRFTVAQFKKRAFLKIKQIYKRNKIPIICGGTGFYIQAIIKNLEIPKVKPDLKLRKKLEKETTESLFKKLRTLDPKRAKTIDSHNKRRLIRALEIIIKTGKPVPRLKKKQAFNPLYIGIKKDSQELKNLIKKRLIKRIRGGLIAEVKNLRKIGVSWKRLDDFGLEYRYVSRYLKGEINKQEMVEELEKEIIKYAKRQMTWLKKYPGKKVHWIKNYNQAKKLIKNFLSF
ncbi:MAG: tRNA (adenosine(37)-N6)-dimethylallyltransferase MiaA [Candidatus Portnoybacteria bacterium]|nr:tRNA (adenosine(37)-N6)-dimethylallyltransferase MiaA [Candidatus Portnoybacteria bacterium]